MNEIVESQAQAGARGVRAWVWGLAVGVAVGMADVALVALADPAAGPWIMLQSFLAWTAMGAFAVTSVGLTGRPWLDAVLVTQLANATWVVALGPTAGHPEHVGPLMGMSLVFSLPFAAVRAKCVRASRPRS